TGAQTVRAPKPKWGGSVLHMGHPRFAAGYVSPAPPLCALFKMASRDPRVGEVVSAGLGFSIGHGPPERSEPKICHALFVVCLGCRPWTIENG
ncbi:hypothetical protein J6590_084423, partial [Homalodisca vitripennis]